MNHLDDPEFIERLKSGDTDAVEELHAHFYLGVRDYLINQRAFDRLEASSFANWILIIAIKKIDTFRGEAKLKTWIYKIVKHGAINYIYSQLCQVDGKLEPRDALNDPQLLSIDAPEFEERSSQTTIDPPPLDSIEKKSTSRQRRLARHILFSLEPRRRHILIKAARKPIRQVAREENIPEGTIRSWLSRVKKQFERELEREPEKPTGKPNERPQS
jgi:RNA polymerase sigma factor (sigma-70 family)